MNYYIKELPDYTVTLMGHNGVIIGKFDNTDDLQGICLDNEEIDWQTSTDTGRPLQPSPLI